LLHLQYTQANPTDVSLDTVELVSLFKKITEKNQKD